MEIQQSRLRPKPLISHELRFMHNVLHKLQPAKRTTSYIIIIVCEAIRLLRPHFCPNPRPIKGHNVNIVSNPQADLSHRIHLQRLPKRPAQSIIPNTA